MRSEQHFDSLRRSTGERHLRHFFFGPGRGALRLVEFAGTTTPIGGGCRNVTERPVITACNMCTPGSCTLIFLSLSLTDLLVNQSLVALRHGESHQD